MFTSTQQEVIRAAAEAMLADAHRLIDSIGDDWEPHLFGLDYGDVLTPQQAVDLALDYIAPRVTPGPGR